MTQTAASDIRKYQELSLQALRAMQGDELEARSTELKLKTDDPHAMAGRYKNTGLTNQQWLEQAQLRHDEISEAIEWVKNLSSG